MFFKKNKKGLLRKEYDEATELFQHVRVLNNSPDIARAIQAIDIDKLR